MLHILLHTLVPFLIAAVAYRPAWRSAFLIMIATMVVDADHLLATPIYDPDRCSIGFHPLHGTVAIGAYAALFVLPLLIRSPGADGRMTRTVRTLHLAGPGLLIHIALDGIDCLT